jgi:glycosyltransferase involved in cell wall biosynthesis
MKISIVMTAYNMNQYIGQAIESCLNQTHEDIELVIVEDCSTDDTLSVIESYMKMDERIKLIVHEKNMGAGWGRHDGINAATGDYFITVDADDWLAPTFIESLVKKAEETGSDIVSGGITIERGNGYWEKTCYGNLVTTGHDKVTKFWGEKVVFMNNKIVRTSLREQVPYCTRRFIEDTPTIIPMLWLANTVAYTEDTGYHYRMQNESLTHKANAFTYALYRALCCMDLIDFFEEKDKELLKKIPLGKMLQKQIEIIKQSQPTKDTIDKYIDEWCEFTKRLLS